MNSINNAESANQISYNNTTSGLAATDVQGAVDEVVERVSRHDIGNFVDISSYTDVNNPYIAPTDGYARVGAGSLRIGTATANFGLMQIDAANFSSVFVRKGTPIYIVLGKTATTTTAYFIPLS